MFIIDLRNKFVSDNHFSVIGNNNADTAYIFSHFTQYASGYDVYLKVISEDETYVDKIKIDNENISIDDGALLVKWTMGEVSTQCKKINIQLQFENGDGTIVAQSRIVSITLGDTINVDEKIGKIYPKVLEQLQHQINELKADSVADFTMSFNSGTLIINLKNKNGDVVATNQVAIKTVQSADEEALIEVNDDDWFALKNAGYANEEVSVSGLDNNYDFARVKIEINSNDYTVLLLKNGTNDYVGEVDVEEDDDLYKVGLVLRGNKLIMTCSFVEAIAEDALFTVNGDVLFDANNSLLVTLEV